MNGVLMEEKIFKGYLILNWKNGSMEIKKRKPKKSKLSPFDIPIIIEIKVIVPERKEIVAKGEIELSEEKVNEMIIESL